MIRFIKHYEFTKPKQHPIVMTSIGYGVPSVIEENKLFTRRHRAIYLLNRNNMFVTWDYRRAREGARAYQGGLVWHEGSITFQRDVNLSGPDFEGAAPALQVFRGGAGGLLKAATRSALCSPCRTMYLSGRLALICRVSARNCRGVSPVASRNRRLKLERLRKPQSSAAVVMFSSVSANRAQTRATRISLR